MMAQSGGANASNNNKKLERIKQTIGISVCERADERMEAERERERGSVEKVEHCETHSQHTERTITSSERENWIVINTVVKYSWTEFVRLTVATVTDTR